MGEAPAGVGEQSWKPVYFALRFLLISPPRFPPPVLPSPPCPPGAQWDPHRLRVTAVPVSLSHQRATVTSATGCPQREGSAGDEGGPVGPSHEEGALIVRCAKQGGCVLEPAW